MKQNLNFAEKKPTEHSVISLLFDTTQVISALRQPGPIDVKFAIPMSMIPQDAEISYPSLSAMLLSSEHTPMQPFSLSNRAVSYQPIITSMDGFFQFQLQIVDGISAEVPPQNYQDPHNVAA